MRNLLLFLAGALLAAGPVAAQVKPKPGAGDPRIQFVDFAPDQVVQLQGAAGYQVTVELSSDEQVENVAVGDSNAWQVTANRRGDHLFVKAIAGGVATNMTVVTSVRLYNFELVPATGSGDMAYTVRFRYPNAAGASSDDAPSAAGEGRYRLGGDKALRPSEISDDGRHTYVRWPRDRALPAVYAMSDTGQEMLVNGMMRDDVFVIDSVSQKLVFRIDKAVATASRVRVEK
ncbi:MAG TPA: TrbG/VirB9 family P-type conjugative transfer protein [Allosphingosinicella sp.]|nr:TrbG/VirB9 family P-type conjugative transfer protein [Allosphingosinicella sp.]